MDNLTNLENKKNDNEQDETGQTSNKQQDQGSIAGPMRKWVNKT